MRDRVIGYWTLSWVGLISNIIAIPIITLITIYEPSLKTTNITLAISLGWPSAIVGIIASSALLAAKKWGVILTMVSLSMGIAGTVPYSVVRLIRHNDIFDISGLTVMTALFSVLILIYWCNPKHRRNIRL